MDAQTAPVSPAVQPVPQTPVTPLVAPKPASKLPWIPLVVVLLVAMGAGGVFLGQRLAKPAAAPTPAVVVPIPTPDPTANWKIYTNPDYAITFMYPPDWTISDCLGDAKGCEGANNIIGLNPPLIKPGSSDLDNFSIEVFGSIYCTTTINSARKVWKWESFNEHAYEISGYKGTLFEGYMKFPNEKTYFRKLAFIQQNEKCFVVNSVNSNEFASQATFDQILSTFKFTDNTASVATPKPVLSPPLLDTSNWKTSGVDNISFKYPPEYSIRINQHSVDLYIDNPSSYGGGIAISVYTYDGGSRRQWSTDWLHTVGGDSLASIEKYTLAKEVRLGTVDALDFWMDGGWWQGGYTSPIIIASGKTIVTVAGAGGRTYDPVTGIISRWNITDTISSTIKFN